MLCNFRTKLYYLLLACAAMNHLIAAPLLKPYQIIVPVSSAENSFREKALQDSFSQEIVKLTGNRQSLQNPLIVEALPKINSYIEKYSYQSQSVSEELLIVDFQSNALQKLLKKANLTLWSFDRPTILAWIALQDKNGATRLLGTEDADPIITQLKKLAEQRGVFLLLPALDLTDLDRVSMEDVLSVQLPTLQKAAQRYDYTDLAVIKLIEQPDSHLSFQATLDNPHSVSIQTADWAEGLNQLIDTLAQIKIPQASEETEKELNLTITQIQNFSEYNQLLKELDRLHSIQKIQVQKILPSSVELKLTLQNLSIPAFQKELALSDFWVASSINGEKANTLVYQWQSSAPAE